MVVRTDWMHVESDTSLERPRGGSAAGQQQARADASGGAAARTNSTITRIEEQLFFSLGSGGV